MGSLFREGWYCSHNTVKTVNLPLKKTNKKHLNDENNSLIFLSLLLSGMISKLNNPNICPHPSTASSRNQIKFSRGCTKGGPLSMDGCFSVYVLNTTEALFLFFKQRNLEGLRVVRRKGELWRWHDNKGKWCSKPLWRNGWQTKNRCSCWSTCWRWMRQYHFLHFYRFWTPTLYSILLRGKLQTKLHTSRLFCI